MKSLLELQQGDELVQPEWMQVSQSDINQFADATGDHQWIHLDKEKCAKESPFKTTIAHGFLTASLMPKAFSQVVGASERIASTINYGIDMLRFLSPVSSDDSVRYKFTVKEITQKSTGLLYKVEASCEIKSSGDLALVGTFLMLAVVTS